MRSTDPSTLRIIDLWSFRSTKSNKRYIVEVERFSNNFLGLKFYWKGYNRKNEMSIFQKRNEQIFSFFASFFLWLFRPLKHQLNAD